MKKGFTIIKWIFKDEFELTSGLPHYKCLSVTGSQKFGIFVYNA